MAERPGSRHRSLYKLMGSPPWKEAFRKVSVRFGKPWPGCCHSPSSSQEPLSSVTSLRPAGEARVGAGGSPPVGRTPATARTLPGAYGPLGVGLAWTGPVPGSLRFGLVCFQCEMCWVGGHQRGTMYTHRNLERRYVYSKRNRIIR